MNRSLLSFILPISIFVLIVLLNIHYIPLWDSRLYFSSCIFPAIKSSFNLMAFNCSNHGSLVFGLLYSGLQYLSLGNTFFIHFTSLVLLLTAFAFLYFLLCKLFNDDHLVMIGMLIVCWNPAVLANALNPTPDLAVFAFSIMCLWAFINHRLMLAALFGLALVFSKESGAVFYTLSCFFYIIYYRKKSLHECLVLIIPFGLYGVFLFYKTQVIQESLLFANHQIHYLLLSLVTPFNNKHFYSSLSAIFLLNFQWLIALGLLVGITLFLKSIRNKNQLSLAKHKTQYFIIMVLLSLCYILTCYPTFLNVRYYLLIFPLTSILFIYTLRMLNKINLGILCGITVAVLFLFSAFLTIDPVSRTYYGTFAFGAHNLLRMTSVNKECCGYGRDQLVYNLEHIQLQNLLNQFAKTITLTSNDIIITDPAANFAIYANLANETNEWTLRENNTHQAIHIANPALINEKYNNLKHCRVFYPQFPNMQNEKLNQKVNRYLEVKSIIEIKNKNYSLKFIQLQSL